MGRQRSLVVILLLLIPLILGKQWMAVVRHSRLVDAQRVDSVLSQMNARLARNLTHTVAAAASSSSPHGSTLVIFDKEHTTNSTIAQFRARLSTASSIVLSDRADVIVRHTAAAAVTTSGATLSWALDRIDQRNSSLDGQYNPGATGAGVRIVVMDTGVAEIVPDLQGRVSHDWTAFPGQPYDCNGHGTHVATSAAGTIYGVAKQALIKSYRFLGCNGEGTLGDFAAAIAAVLGLPDISTVPTVINLSLEYPGYDATIDALLQQAIALDVAVVAAAGNSGAPTCAYPSVTTGVVAVGATTSMDQVASYSNQGSCVDVFSPGSNVLAGWLNGGTQILSGTSMASGITSGSVALLRQQFPFASQQDIVRTLLQDATLNALTQISASSGNRLLYIFANGGLATTAPPPPPPASTTPAAPTILRGGGIPSAASTTLSVAGVATLLMMMILLLGT